jgi:hypothetical protein
MNGVPGEIPKPDKRSGPAATWAQRGAVTVEYALVMLIAAAILIGVEEKVFRPMAKDILENFMECIVKPDP